MNLLSSVQLRIVLNVDEDPVIYLSAATDPDPAIYRSAVEDPDPAFAITLEVKILHFFWPFFKISSFLSLYYLRYFIYE
jgi:hypothetical protein